MYNDKEDCKREGIFLDMFGGIGKVEKVGFFCGVVALSCLFLVYTARSVTITTPTTITNGLVGRWTFDGANVNATQVLDISGNTKHGTQTAITVVAGKFGQGGSFNGATSLVNSGNVSATVNSIGFWMKTTSSTTKLIDLNGTATVELIGNVITANNFTGAVIYVNGVISSTITSNKWNYVVITATTAVNASAVKFGNVGTLYYLGSMDEIRMYNKVLSAQEVLSLYNQGQSKISSSVSIGLQGSGLVGWWTFDGAKTGSTYAVGNVGNSGVMTGSPKKVIGKIGQALNFNGTSQYVTITQNIPQNGLNYTMSAWVKGGGDTKVLYASSLSTVSAMINNGKLNCMTNGDSWKTGTIVIPTTAWTHVVCLYNGTNSVGYVNGVKDVDTPDNVPSADITTLAISGNQAQNGLFLGNIDDFRYWNRMLTLQEITQLYNQGNSKINSSLSINTQTNGLIGYWPFSGSDCGTTYCIDKSGNNLTVSSSAASTFPSKVVGKIGQALKFDGADDAINVSSNSLLSFGSSDFSISLWIKPESFAAEREIYDSLAIGGLGGRTNAFVLVQSITTGKLRIFSNASYTSATTNVLSLNKWNHIVISRVSGTVYFFINGVQDPISVAMATNITNGSMVIGRFADTGSGFTKGSVDNIRIYNRALSLREIRQLYQVGK